MKKIYVLDTNILMQSPGALFGFADNDIYLPITVIQELDKHKTDSGERGYNTREAIRKLDDLRRTYSREHEKGEFGGMPLISGGMLYIVPDEEKSFLPEGCLLSVPDNRIINTVIKLTKEKKEPVILVTNDTSMRFNAFGMSQNSIAIQEYKNETIESDEMYTGKGEAKLTKAAIDAMFAGEDLPFSCEDTHENEFIHVTALEDPKTSGIAIYRNGHLHMINTKGLCGFNGVRGRNFSQNCLLYALNAPASEIPLVIAKGPAGTGKTILSVACGLNGVYRAEGHKYNSDDCEYSEMLMTRANVIMDNDLGFLPGDLEEKMNPLIQPFIDNMENIFGGKGKERDIEMAKDQIDYVRSRGIVNICSVAYLRGRTLENKYLIVDEAQNLTVQQVLTIITRAGEYTKIVLIGDPDQVDAKYLDRRNNGLVFASEKMKGSKYCAQITFEQEEAVRSPLAMEAAKRLTL